MTDIIMIDQLPVVLRKHIHQIRPYTIKSYIHPKPFFFKLTVKLQNSLVPCLKIEDFVLKFQKQRLTDQGHLQK